MKVKLLKNLETVMPKIIQQDLPIKIAFRLNNLLDEIESQLLNVEKFRQKYFEKYGEKMDDGRVRIERSKIEEFENGINDLLEEEVDVKPVAIPLSILFDTGIKVSVLEIEALKLAGFIDDDINNNE